MEAPERKPVVIPPSQPVSTLPLPAGTTRWGTDLAKMAETEKEMQTVSNKTPEVVKAAISPKVLAVGGLELHRFNFQTYINLEDIGSPFVDRAEKPEGWQPSSKNIRDALYVMFAADEKVAEEISRGLEVFHASAVKFGTSLEFAQMSNYAAAIYEQIARGFAPAAKMNPPSREGGDIPLEATSSETAPAGS